MSINQIILNHKLRLGDAVELACPTMGFPKHYAVYMGTREGNPEFIANLIGGVKIVRGTELSGFLCKYEVTNVERFSGNELERRMIVRKALARLGEKAYSFVFNNCEHFKNWVLYGESKSRQVDLISSGIGLAGLGLYIAGLGSNKKGLQKVGFIILVLLAIAFVIAWWILKDKTED